MKRFLCMVALMAMALSSFAAELVVKNSRLGQTHNVALLDKKGATLVPLASLAAAAGYSSEWDVHTRCLCCKNEGFELCFVQDNAFVKISGGMQRLLAAPQRIGGTLYAELEEVITLFAAHPGMSCQWVPATFTLTIARPIARELKSLGCKLAAGQSVIELGLNDSATVQCDYEHPFITLRLARVRCAPKMVKAMKGCGVVDSLLVISWKDSTHVVVQLTKAVKTPVLSWSVVQGAVLRVGLQPQTPVGAPPSAALPDSQLFGDGSSGALRTIVIDAGHGGKDPGALGGGIYEKDITLGIALQLHALLKADGRVKSILTRERDEYIGLRERTRFANEKKADLFISIHVNAVPGDNVRRSSVQGYKVYFLSQAKNEEDKLVAMRENAVVELEEKSSSNDYLQNIITEMVGNEYLRESQEFSILLSQQFDKSIDSIAKLHLGVGQGPFWVLNGAYMPSVLIETGFISNPAEAQRLAQKSVQRTYAKAIFDAIMTFKGKYEAGL